MDVSEKHSKVKTIWLLIIIFLFALSNTVWGLLYIKQNSDKHQADSQVASLNSEKSNLTSKIKALEKTTTEVPVEPKTATPAGWREIPELGVKYKVTEATKDITYLYSPNGGTGLITLSTKSLSDSKYNAKNPSGTPLEVYGCGLNLGTYLGESIFAGSLGFIEGEYKQPTEKRGADIVKKLPNNKTYLFSEYAGSYDGGNGILDEKNAFSPAPSDGCNANLLKSAKEAAKALVNSLEPI